MWWRALAGLAVLSCAGALAAAPDCAGEIELGDAHIMRVEHNGVLVMTDGRALSLEGIRLPNAALDHSPQIIADQAFAALTDLAKGRELDAYAVWPKEDRYDRVRSQIFDHENGAWLQIEMLKRGLARVDLSPDRGECFRDLYAAEADARKAGLGLWANPAYGFKAASELTPADAGTFQIVVGKVLNTATQDGRVFLNFGADWRSDFTVTISADDLKTFRRMGVDPMNYEGKLVRVRGVVQAENGPAIAVGNPKQIELLQ